MSQMSSSIHWDAVCLWVRCLSFCMLDPPNCIQCSTPLNHTAYAADRIDKDRNLKTLHIMMCLSTCLCLFKLGPDLLYIERLKAPFPSLPFPSLPFPSLPFPSLPFPSLPFLYHRARASTLHLSRRPCSRSSCCCLAASLLMLQLDFVSF